MFSVFGTRPVDAIFLGDAPFRVRWNCKSGGAFADSEEEDARLTKPTEILRISIMKATRWYGNLGKTKAAEWMQLFYVAAPGCPGIPQNEVCCSYIKGQSINSLRVAVALAQTDKDAGVVGIFTAAFDKKAGEKGAYYAIKFGWEQRKTEAELKQLEQIQDFMLANPILLDLDSTRDMTCLEGLSAMEIQAIANHYRAQLSPAPDGSAPSQMPGNGANLLPIARH